MFVNGIRGYEQIGWIAVEGRKEEQEDDEDDEDDEGEKKRNVQDEWVIKISMVTIVHLHVWCTVQ